MHPFIASVAGSARLDGSTSETLLLILSAFAGAIHMLAPDHWMPLSLKSWQRQWGQAKTLVLSLLALAGHLGVGFAIYLILRPLIITYVGSTLFMASVALVIAGAILRAARFGSIREILRMGSNRIWSTLSVLSLLGPCESLIPVMIKAHHLGVGYLVAFAGFAAGTLLSGLLLIFAGRYFWNHPIRLNQGVSWALQRRSVLPVLAGVTAGLIFLLKL